MEPIDSNISPPRKRLQSLVDMKSLHEADVSMPRRSLSFDYQERKALPLVPYRVPNKYILFDIFSYAEYQHVSASKFRLLSKLVRDIIDKNLEILKKNTVKEERDVEFITLLLNLSKPGLKNFRINIVNPRFSDSLGMARRVLNFLSNLKIMRRLDLQSASFRLNQETVSVLRKVIAKFPQTPLLTLTETPQRLETEDLELLAKKFVAVDVESALDGKNARLLSLPNLRKLSLGLEVINQNFNRH